MATVRRTSRGGGVIGIEDQLGLDEGGAGEERAEVGGGLHVALLGGAGEAGRDRHRPTW